MNLDTKNYVLPGATISTLTAERQLADLMAMCELINDRGINTKNTRIERYVTYLKQEPPPKIDEIARIFKNSDDERLKQPIDWWLYVLREIEELRWIYKGLIVNYPTGIDERLRVIVAGRDFASLDLDSKARNIQFELRIASYFCQAGWTVHLDQETDIIALSENTAYYVECKRIAGADQPSKRLKNARDQLKLRMPAKYKNRNAFGLVAADVTKVAFNHNGLTCGLTNEHSRDVIQDKLLKIGENIRNLQPDGNSDGLLLYWLQIHIPALILNPPQTATRFSSLHIDCDTGNAANRLAKREFREMFEDISTREDQRSLKAIDSLPSSVVTLPKGTQFSLIHRAPLLELMEREEDRLKSSQINIGSISVNGMDQQFYLSDLLSLEPGLIENWKSEAFNDPAESSLRLVLEMYEARLRNLYY